MSLEEILQKLGEDEKKVDLKFMFARQIAPFNIETILALLYIKKIIDGFGDKVKEVILDSLQWKDDMFSFHNEEKKIFVRPQILYSKLQYPISVKSMNELKRYSGRYNIGYIDLDVNKIRKMIEETGLTYMEKSLDDLIQKGKVKDGRVNILDFWGLTTLYYISEISSYIFGINDYEIKEFKDKIRLINGDEFDISGYELKFEYKGIELRFRIYDASHIHKEENEKYKKEEKTKINSYIALTVYSRSGYILLEEDPEKSSVDQKIRDFYMEAKKKTGYNILLLEVDEKKLIERGIVSEEDYVKLIGKDEIRKIIDTIRETYGI
ncbi:MAG: hypothetical protein ACO2OX_04970 [Candidatus Nanopusillus sp.]